MCVCVCVFGGEGVRLHRSSGIQRSKGAAGKSPLLWLKIQGVPNHRTLRE